MSRIKEIVVAAIAGAALAVASVTAIAQDSNDETVPPGSTPPVSSPPGAKTAVASVDSTVAAVVSGLGGVGAAEDVLPADVAQYVDWAPIEGANGRLSRRALEKGGRILYLVPGDGVACLLLTGPGPGATGPLCDSPEDLGSASGGPGVLHNDCATSGDEVPTCSGATLFGVVPDGVREVTVHLTSGSPVATPVENNAYLVDVPTAPLRVAFQTSAGKVAQVTP